MKHSSSQQGAAGMLLTTFEMATRLEEADTIHLTRQVEACGQIFPNQNSVVHTVGSGVAGVTIPLFGAKLNRVVGFGMAGRVSSEDLAVIQKLYSEHNLPPAVHLCPHADETAVQALALGGYSVRSWISNYVRPLTDEDLQETDISGIEISRITPERSDEFLSNSVAGYRDNGRPELLLETLARIAVLRADTHIYFAMVDGQIAGSAGLALIETSKGGIAHLYIDSTLPGYRGRGIQAALLRARLSEARRAGFDLASVGARPTSASSRNIERAGFSLAYTKTMFSKSL